MPPSHKEALAAGWGAGSSGGCMGKNEAAGALHLSIPAAHCFGMSEGFLQSRSLAGEEGKIVILVVAIRHGVSRGAASSHSWVGIHPSVPSLTLLTKKYMVQWFPFHWKDQEYKKKEVLGNV